MTAQSTVTEKLTIEEFLRLLARATDIPENRFHPFVWILGEPEIGADVYIGGFSEVNARGARIIIGDNCDIASFVSINCADTHMRCIELSETIARGDIVIEDHVFIGSHSMVKGGAHIGHHSVVAAGTIVEPGAIPPYSLIAGNPMVVKAGYYRGRFNADALRP
jgi:acetyltransferase-like isoleucine patch superfamily enzyme